MRQVTEFMPDIDLNDVIKALGNPVRRKILHMLKEPKIHFHQPYADADEFGVCVSIIQEKVGLSQSTVSLYLFCQCRLRQLQVLYIYYLILA